MDLFYRVALAIHIAAGAVALAVFWVPLVTKKGGKPHRRLGWVYVVAAATIAVTGAVVCSRLIADPRPLRSRAGVFLLYIGVLAGASAHHGIRALVTKKRTGPSRTVVDLGPPILLALAGVALAAYGVRQAMPLYMAFAALGTVQGVSRVRFWWFSPRGPKEWLIAHMGGMGTSCITTVTAFCVVNAQRLGLHTFDLVLWVGPGLVGGLGLGFWVRHYRRRFATAGMAP